MEAIANLARHDPYLDMTKFERDEAYRLRQVRFSARSVPDRPIRCPSASERAGLAPSRPLQPEPLCTFDQWLNFWKESGGPKLVDHEVTRIQKVVARFYNVTRIDICSKRRTARVVKPRQIGMYLAKAMTLQSYPEIGRRFGNRDHTTVMHAERKIAKMIKSDESFCFEIEALKAEIARVTG
jgi:Bacterial dnaA protein helix-turn-helix